MTTSEIYGDVHMHTHCSDGCLAPADLVAKASARGLQGLSVTDHDTLRGVESAAREAESRSLHFVPGIELSVTVEETEIHLLAYGFDPSHSPLRKHLQTMQRAREERAWEMIERLRALGLEIDDDGLREEIRSTHAVGRPHVAAVLVREGHVGSMQQAFEQYLGNSGPGYVSKPSFPAAEALTIIHAAEGIGVLAHPGHWTSSSHIRHLVDVGLDGIEIYHPSHDASLRGYYQRLANGYDLLTTGGSDYHGRTEDEERYLGTVGMDAASWERFREAVA